MKKKVSIPKFLLLITTCLLMAGCSLNNADQVEPTPASEAVQENGGVISEGNLVPREDQYLAFPTGGEVEEVLVRKGDFVRAGQVVARLADRQQAQAAIAAANLELVSAQMAYDDLQRTSALAKSQSQLALANAHAALTSAERLWSQVDSDDFLEELDDAKVTLEEETEDLQDAQAEFDKYAGVSADNAKRKKAKTALNNAQEDYDAAKWAWETLNNEYERAQAELSRAQTSLEEAQRAYDDTLNGPDPDQLALVEARLASANAQMDAAQSALDKFELKSPFDGTVLDVNVNPRQLVSPDTWVVLVAQTDDWYVETNDLTELDVVDIEIGQKAAITFDALPDLKLSGEVVDISDIFESRSGDILYTVRLRLDETDPRLRWGMTAQVDFNPQLDE